MRARARSGRGLPGRLLLTAALVAIVAGAVVAVLLAGLFGELPGRSSGGERWASFARASCEWSNVTTPPGICFGERPPGFRVRILEPTGPRWHVWDPSTQGPAYVDADALTSE